MENWFMLTLVGADRPGIVARVTRALFEGGCDLGEASMMRLGGNFTIMMMTRSASDADALEAMLRPVNDALGLRVHVDRIDAQLHRHVEPDVHVTVSGADRAGIVAEATEALFNAGLDILNLESDVAGSVAAPLYIMHIEGRAAAGIEALQSAVDAIGRQGINATLTPVEILVG